MDEISTQFSESPVAGDEAIARELGSTAIEDSSPENPAAMTPASTIHAARSGQWMEPADLRRWAMEQIEGRGNASPQNGSPRKEAQRSLVLDLSRVEYLDASALQVLLAIQAEQRGRGAGFQLVNSSPQLRRWFEYAGAADLLDAPATLTTLQATYPEESVSCEEF
jgi:ABC-type transporter Mla MlaB component